MKEARISYQAVAFLAQMHWFREWLIQKGLDNTRLFSMFRKHREFIVISYFVLIINHTVVISLARESKIKSELNENLFDLLY